MCYKFSFFCHSKFEPWLVKINYTFLILVCFSWHDWKDKGIEEKQKTVLTIDIPTPCREQCDIQLTIPPTEWNAACTRWAVVFQLRPTTVQCLSTINRQQSSLDPVSTVGIHLTVPFFVSSLTIWHEILASFQIIFIFLYCTLI